jgi:hypothetical protein
MARGSSRQIPSIPRLPNWRRSLRVDLFADHVKKMQQRDETFSFRLLKGKDPDLPLWICPAVCRSLARWG